MARRLDKEPRKQHPKFTPEPGFRTKWLPRLIIGGGLVAVAIVFTLAFQLGNTGGDDAPLDQAVESVFPTSGALEPRQTQVTIDLDATWQLESLIIEGTPIEFRDIDLGGEALGIYTFQPGPGRPIEVFEVGEVRVLAIVSNRLEPTEQRTISWAFTAT